MSKLPKKVLMFANTEWYLFNFRLPLAKHLREQGVEVIMVSPFGPYGKKIETEGFRWIGVPMSRRSLNPITEIRLLWRLFKIYQVEKPDIAHHFTIKCVVYGGLVASAGRIHGVVSAVTGLGYVFIGNDFRAKILRPIVRQLLRFVIDGANRRLILQNPDDKQVFLNSGLIKSDYVRMIAGSGVDTQRFQPRSIHVQLERPRARVVFAARLLWDKGVAEFVAAAQRLYAQGINAEFVIAGDPDPGNPASIPEETLSKWRELPFISMLGHVADMAAFLESADVMVLPSYREGLPRGLIEAAAAGLPIVTTDVPGCRETVENGVNGFLTPARDSSLLAEALLKLLENPELAKQMGVAGRAKALSEFDEQLVFSKTLDVYRELVTN
jgi:glycosyltransferase involved in cell wall biosynthesis